MKYFQNKQTQYIADEEIERIDSLKNELYKERCKLADQRREYNKLLREEARFEILVDVLKDKVECLPEIKLNAYNPSLPDNNLTAVLQFSDWHSYKIIDNQWNFYNYDVMVERANSIVDKAIQKCKVHNVGDLILEINGDMLEGLIHISSRTQAEEDVIQQIVGVSELLAQCINKLKPHFNSIKIVTTLGNHGRMIANKTEVITKENFEMLIPEFLKLRLSDDIPIIKSNGLDFTSYEIDGELICVAHGQNDKIATVISDFAKMYKRVPKEVHLGHTHSYKDINDCDIMITVNGCLEGSDDYAISLRKLTEPCQNLIIYGADRCIYGLKAN